MKLRDKGSAITYHVPQEVGAKLVAAGLADEVKEWQPKPKPSGFKWWTQPGAKVEEFEYPPYICHSSCGLCSQGNGFVESWQGTAHETAVIRHCGKVERVPADVAAEYLKLFAAWRAKNRYTAPPVEPISASSPLSDIRAAGLKTREELIAEATGSAKKFAVRTI